MKKVEIILVAVAAAASVVAADRAVERAMAEHFTKNKTLESLDFPGFCYICIKFRTVPNKTFTLFQNQTPHG